MWLNMHGYVICKPGAFCHRPAARRCILLVFHSSPILLLMCLIGKRYGVKSAYIKCTGRKPTFCESFTRVLHIYDDEYVANSIVF